MRSFYVALIGALILVVPGLPQVVNSQGGGKSGVLLNREWPVVGGDLTNQRYSTLDQINTSSIDQRGGAWVSKRFGDGAATKSAPVVKDGMMYVTAGSRVYALNAKTGEEVWAWQTDVKAKPNNLDVIYGLIEALNAGNGFPSTQGVAVGDGSVFVGLLDSRLVALDQRTGKEKWIQHVGPNPPQTGQALSNAVTYANGVVYTGVANGDWALRGRVSAVEAKSGRVLWDFPIIPAEGENGHETWAKDNDLWKQGGGGVWLTGAVDPDLGMVYFGTGNTVPMFAGEVRPGDNLFTASVVALDIKTGKLKWYYQLVHHDLWEADVSVPLVLYDTQFGSKPYKALAAMRADGYLFMLDRETGKPIFPVEEQPVPQDPFQKTSPTQPHPVGADSLLPVCASDWKGKIPAGFTLGCIFSPPSLRVLNLLAPDFGVRVAPLSYSPITGYFYAQANADVSWRRRAEDPFFRGPNPVPGLKGYAVLAAIDSRTNRIVWKKEMLRRPAGSMTTAGGLLFETEADGSLRSYDARTGKELWSFQTGLPGARGPATTYEIDGEQYVAMPAGPVVWAFKLGGPLKSAAAPILPSNADDFVGPITDTNVVETTSLDRNTIKTGGNRYYIDEYEFSPYRARIRTGSRVTWVNNGTMAHEIVALDGSWTTGPLNMAQQSSVVFDKPGTYAYMFKIHPWVYGQIIVSAGDQQNGIYTNEQAQRGKTQFLANCSGCHGEDLSGRSSAPSLAGDAFMLRWQGSTVGNLLEKIRNTMPPQAAGGLSVNTYVDIVTYLLQSNNLPAGKGELNANSPELSSHIANH